MDKYPFACTDYRINDKVQVTIIDIDKIDESEKAYIDKAFVRICEGSSESDIATVKKRVARLFAGKKFEWKMGAIAEFFIHLYMLANNFKQEFLYLNLEENSIKKGFDGYYSKIGQDWLMESKAGSVESRVSHASKVREAMKDLSNKVSGKTSNNPWQEAYSHASHIDVGSESAIRKKIKKLSDEFVNGKYNNIENFNTMPCGTIFLTGIWQQQNHEAIKKDIGGLLPMLEGTNIHVVCTTQKSVEMFLQYIEAS